MDHESDRALATLVRPADWPKPRSRTPYNLIVIGGGTAGLVAAVGAAGLGARVALAERDRLGGECLNTGCVPSKALLRTARTIGELRRADGLGVRVAHHQVDDRRALGRMRERRLALAPHDSAERLAGAGVDVFFGRAVFADTRTLTIGAETLRFKRAVIATGSRPALPIIAGLDEVPCLTNETIFDLTARPDRLLIVGGGAVGCELAQAFARLGSHVVLFEQGDRILPHDDRDAAAIVQRALAADGVRIELAATITSVVRHDGGIVARFNGSSHGGHEEIAGDRLLVAAGRAPNIEALDLARAGIAVGPHGLTVDDHLRTTNRRVYAAGDVCGRLQFTHAADAMARLVIQNALFFGRRRASSLTIPWCTYTEPELAHVGLAAKDVPRTPAVQTITIPLSEIDRAVLDDEPDGFMRVHHRGGRVVGCTIVGPRAGDLIGYAGAAIARHATLNEWAATIYPYPTYAEAFRKAGDTYRRGRLTPSVRRWFDRFFRLTRW